MECSLHLFVSSGVFFFILLNAKALVPAALALVEGPIGRLHMQHADKVQMTCKSTVQYILSV